ncbi:homoserine kinase [Paludibacterium purpuratum]|uniref:Homoserine kinase n=1 Tax=Paludibacterium purpuratum TaxID=1144873 RepID=A0A4R7BAP5_9NEIS|nr:homoserine kinase [Paludibacterium purpuratum]TDR80727.1 homoserine kinase [Paludibacterium purpuratum]
MSVFTVVTDTALRDWLRQYELQLVSFEGIAAGVTNTNYFVDTTHGRFVLTLFETLKLDEVPFYLELMSHLARHGVACPAPLLDRQDRLASMLCDRPACLVSCLHGRDIDAPSSVQCCAVGDMLATQHRAAATFKLTMDNPRGPGWWAQTAKVLYPLMTDAEAALLRDEIRFQAQYRTSQLPRGVIHADLFKDNVLMAGDAIAGFIDFYYACNDVLIYDVAIALNDWARLPDGSIDAELARAFLQGYQAVRPFDAAEIEAWPTMLRAAALRFWVSRLLDLHHPMAGALTYTKDPGTFRALLVEHRARSDFWL